MMDSIVETSTSAAPRGSALRPQSVPRTQHTGWVFGLRPKISQRDHGFLRLRLRQPCSRWLTGVLHVLRRLGGGSVKGRSSLVRSGARRQGPGGRSSRDLTSRCSGRGRLRPLLVEGLGEPAPQLNGLDVRSTNLDLRKARNVWAAPADCEFQKSLVRGAEVLRRSRWLGAEKAGGGFREAPRFAEAVPLGDSSAGRLRGCWAGR